MKKSSSRMPTSLEPLKFYKTKDMREHEEKSKMAVKTFLENLKNRSRNKQISTSKSQSSITASSVLSAGTMSTKSTLQSAQNNIKATTAQPLFKASPDRFTSVRSTSASGTITQNKLIQSNKDKFTKTPNCTTAEIQYKEPLRFYKTRDMREHEEKSKWAVQTFWENLNNRTKKLVQSNESDNISTDSISQSFSIQTRKETLNRPTEQVNRIAISGKDKAICKKDSSSSESTNKLSTLTFSKQITEASISNSTVQPMELSVLDTDQLLTKFSNKRKYTGDGEIGDSKSIKITIPATRKHKEFSMKVNLPNRPAPKVNSHTQSIVSGTSKNNGVKTLVQLCTMTLVSNKHRLYQLGNAPYHLLEPILRFCTDEELRQLEEVNSRLIDEDMELWKRFLKQKLPGQPLPSNSGDYRKKYLAIIDEEKEKKERIIGNFRKAMAEEKAKKEARQIKILSVAPREPKRRTSGYQKLTTLQKIRKEMIREGYIMFPHHNT